MIDWASASTLAITGSSISSGSRPRTRATRSRTSLAATSGSAPRRKRTVMRLCSGSLDEVSVSMPSMPAIEPSSTCVTWLSMISALAPRYSVRTETIGSSMFGYSRTVRREYDTRPTSTMSRLVTIENTRRRMKKSKKFTSDPRAQDADRRAVADLLVPGGDHHVLAGEALAHLHLPGPALAELHAGEHRAAVDHPVDEALRALGEHRRFGHQQRVLAPLDHDLHAREEARRQLAARVRDARAQPDGAAGHVDDRVDGIDLALEGLAGQGVDGDADRLAAAQLRQRELLDAEIHLHRIDVRQLDDALPWRDIGTDADRAQPDDARQRRPKGRLLQPRLRQRLAGFGGLQRGLGFIEGPLGAHAALGERLGALMVGARERQVGARLGELGLEDRGVELDQHVAGGHRLAFAKADALHAPGDFRDDRHRLVGAQRAHRPDVLHHRVERHLRRLDRDRVAQRRARALRRCAAPDAGLRVVVNAAGDKRADRGENQPETSLPHEPAWYPEWLGAPRRSAAAVLLRLGGARLPVLRRLLAPGPRARHAIDLHRAAHPGVRLVAHRRVRGGLARRRAGGAGDAAHRPAARPPRRTAGAVPCRAGEWRRPDPAVAHALIARVLSPLLHRAHELGRAIRHRHLRRAEQLVRRAPRLR